MNNANKALSTEQRAKWSAPLQQLLRLLMNIMFLSWTLNKPHSFNQSIDRSEIRMLLSTFYEEITQYKNCEI